MAGGNGGGDALNQLNGSYAVFVDSDAAVVITDYYNHRVVKWNQGASTGAVVAGGQCGNIDQGEICHPTAMTFDKEGNMFITVEDEYSGGVIIWKKGATSGETLINVNSSLYGIALDADETYLYVSHHDEHCVVKYLKNGTFDSVVAGGNGNGSAFDQLNYRRCLKHSPVSERYLFISLARGVTVNKDGSVYVSDSGNHRVVKWIVNATKGIIVAGGNNNGSRTDQLTIPNGIIVDENETIYVADNENHRVMSIPAGTRNGIIIAGGHGQGNASNQFLNVDGLAFNCQGDLYVTDWGNYRVQMFAMDKTPSSGSNSDYISFPFSKCTFLYCFVSFIISVTI